MQKADIYPSDDSRSKAARTTGAASPDHDMAGLVAGLIAGLSVTRLGAIAIVTLDRAAKRNAIDSQMRRTLTDALAGLADDPMVYGILIRAAGGSLAQARPFSAGGDIVELYHQVQCGPEVARANIMAEHALVWSLECFNKPTVSFIDGTVIGSGVGLTLYGTHRVAGPGYRFQMPETAIGLCPDVGVAHVFARMPREIGTYLGLTGRAIDRADALHLGLATHCIAAEHFAGIETAFAGAEPIDPLLDDRHEPPGPAPLDAHADTIERCFGAPTVEEIVARLGARTADRDWCAGVIADLGGRSPLALKVALRHIRRARHLDLRQTLAVDHRIASRLLVAPDFAQAVRARLIERTAAPRWQPLRLEDVSEAMLDRVFAAMPGSELVLPTLQEM